MSPHTFHLCYSMTLVEAKRSYYQRAHCYRDCLRYRTGGTKPRIKQPFYIKQWNAYSLNNMHIYLHLTIQFNSFKLRTL